MLEPLVHPRSQSAPPGDRAQVEGIGHAAFTREDVIRHDLVARIVEAYETAAVVSRRDREGRP